MPLTSDQTQHNTQWAFKDRELEVLCSATNMKQENSASVELSASCCFKLTPNCISEDSDTKLEKLNTQMYVMLPQPLLH